MYFDCTTFVCLSKETRVDTCTLRWAWKNLSTVSCACTGPEIQRSREGGELGDIAIDTGGGRRGLWGPQATRLMPEPASTE